MEIKKVKNHVLIDVEALAKEAGSLRTANIVLLGAALPYLGLPEQYIEDAIRSIFARKGEDIVELNLKALRASKK